ncbi:MAG: hypothetical protein V3U92_11835 [Cellulophaga sp.]
MKYIATFFLSLITITTIMSQDKNTTNSLPYYEVPEYAGKYTAGTVAARMIDGLGFRYRWATENLREEDLNYKPSEDARTTLETIDHILILSRMIVNATLKTPIDFTKTQPKLTAEEKRKNTLNNFKTASDILLKLTDLEELKIQMITKGGTIEYPFWNNINGPIADAIWHAGQIASFRRSSGNGISSKVGFLDGKIKK